MAKTRTTKATTKARTPKAPLPPAESGDDCLTMAPPKAKAAMKPQVKQGLESLWGSVGVRYPEIPRILTVCEEHGSDKVLELVELLCCTPAHSIHSALAAARALQGIDGFDIADPDFKKAIRLRDEAWERTHGNPAYTVTEVDSLCWHAPGHFDVERTIATELEEFSISATDDRAIWCGTKLVAVIRTGPDGKPVVTRFDEVDAPEPPDPFELVDGVDVLKERREGPFRAIDLMDVGSVQGHYQGYGLTLADIAAHLKWGTIDPGTPGDYSLRFDAYERTDGREGRNGTFIGVVIMWPYRKTEFYERPTA